eukprot:TRINITY_DN6908_c0_g1_i1.p1 TRINITY_DN6908_c0_g1~~TRINITY_DN6908_c0_g1_i1.p1  ORF type:complete len:320 (+),score=60.70 TRINITY_DN6908_c0_g1_i1:44-1003(+)
MSVKQLWNEIRTRIPPTTTSFAYGSAVFVQQNRKKGSMTDFIFVVDDVAQWHNNNIAMNPSHYSGISRFGAAFIHKVQQSISADVYFNPYVKIDGELIKYGIVSTTSLQSDLQTWKNLYIAGRLQKPVLFTQPNESISKDLDINLKSAVDASLLLLPSKFTEQALYETIVSLSYKGDIRMLFAEDPAKIQNIAMGSFDHFQTLYRPILKEYSHCLTEISPGMFEVEQSSLQRSQLFHRLPSTILRRISHKSITEHVQGLERVHLFDRIEPHLSSVLIDSLSETVRASSLRQTLLGIFSAGVRKSLSYSAAKVIKRVKQG